MPFFHPYTYGGKNIDGTALLQQIGVGGNVDASQIPWGTGSGYWGEKDYNYYKERFSCGTLKKVRGVVTNLIIILK